MENHVTIENFKTKEWVAQVQREEVIQQIAMEKRLKKERRILLGYFVVSMLATLLISGALSLGG